MERHIKMFKNTKVRKKGSLSLEAAIFLPFVIIAVLSLSFMLKVNSKTEAVMNTAIDEARLLSIESYTPIGKAKALVFPSRLEKRIAMEMTEVQNVDVSQFFYMYKKKGLNKLISFDVGYFMKPKLGMDMQGDIYVQEHIITRAFVGQDDYFTEKGFKWLEEDETSEKVWVFPKAGEKYHRKNCRYISNHASKMSLNKSISRNYEPCKLCEAATLKNGSSVYCFRKYGNVYHRGSCNAVDKYVVEMEKNEAIKKGYGACSICGGS